MAQHGKRMCITQSTEPCILPICENTRHREECWLTDVRFILSVCCTRLSHGDSSRFGLFNLDEKKWWRAMPRPIRCSARALVKPRLKWKNPMLADCNMLEPLVCLFWVHNKKMKSRSNVRIQRKKWLGPQIEPVDWAIITHPPGWLHGLLGKTYVARHATVNTAPCMRVLACSVNATIRSQRIAMGCTRNLLWDSGLFWFGATA